VAETSSALADAPFAGDVLSRAEEFARESFVMPGEDPAQALAVGTARRAALEDALAEMNAGRGEPSVEWRRAYSLMLGLERLLSDEEPHLADGAVLNAHQVDALSGTLVALTSELQMAKSTNGRVAPPEELPSGEVEIEGDDLPDEEPLDWDPAEEAEEEAATDAAVEDAGAARRFWFEHATGAGKTVAALGFVEASRTGGILILTHRRNLVDQFLGELKSRGYRDRISAPLLRNGGGEPPAGGPVTVETYQWFVRNSGKVSDAYTIVICDEAHTALGEKTSASIRQWLGPVFIGMTATGALIARHVTDLFPTQTSRFDLAQAARRGVIAPLRCVRIPPGVGVRSIANVPLRRGEVDQDFDQEELAALLDQTPFNTAVADLYKTRFKDVPGVVYSAGVKHAHNVAKAFAEAGMKAKAVSGETPKRELTRTLAAYERGEIDVLVNAQLLAEGWNSPRATVCMHLAPTASKRIYQQRVGRVTRRTPGKEAGIVVDFVHPATPNDDPVVTLHSLLDRDVYRGGAIVVGPVRRGRGRRLRVERRVVPVTADPERRAQVFERELWRIAVEHLSWGEQQAWAMLAGARVASNNWRRAKAMLHFDSTGELRRTFLVTCLRRNRNTQLRLRALSEIGALRDPEAFDDAVEIVGSWSRDERREGVKVLLQALTEKQIGRRDQAARWLWHLAEYSREVHEEYAVQRWPETKRLLGLLVNSAGAAHARNARRLVQAARKQDRRLSAALLAAALAHTPEAQQVLDGARMRMARKPSALARELLKNFPKGKRRRGGRRRRKRGGGDAEAAEGAEVAVTQAEGQETPEPGSPPDEGPAEAPDPDEDDQHDGDAVPPDEEPSTDDDRDEDDQDAPGEEQDAPGEPHDERDAA
jgi:superfamily II DNA or RNA helicase